MFCFVKRPPLVIPLVVLVALGCSQPPVVDTTEADVQAIRSIVDAFDVAIIAGDFEALAELYDEDGIRMPADAPPQIGRAAIREWFRGEAEQNQIEIDNVVVDAQVFGDWGYSWGTSSGLLTPRNGDAPMVIDSKWLAVTRRQADGSWKTYRDIFNRNAPTPND